MMKAVIVEVFLAYSSIYGEPHGFFLPVIRCYFCSRFCNLMFISIIISPQLGFDVVLLSLVILSFHCSTVVVPG